MVPSFNVKLVGLVQVTGRLRITENFVGLRGNGAPTKGLLETLVSVVTSVGHGQKANIINETPLVALGMVCVPLGYNDSSEASEIAENTRRCVPHFFHSTSPVLAT